MRAGGGCRNARQHRRQEPEIARTTVGEQRRSPRAEGQRAPGLACRRPRQDSRRAMRSPEPSHLGGNRNWRRASKTPAARTRARVGVMSGSDEPTVVMLAGTRRLSRIATSTTSQGLVSARAPHRPASATPTSVGCAGRTSSDIVDLVADATWSPCGLTYDEKRRPGALGHTARDHTHEAPSRCEAPRDASMNEPSLAPADLGIDRSSAEAAHRRRSWPPLLYPGHDSIAGPSPSAGPRVHFERGGPAATPSAIRETSV